MSKTNSKQTPPLTAEARMNKLISLALDQAEEELKEGTASSQIVSLFIKQANLREQVELEKIELEKQLLAERIQSEKVRQNLETMYADVVKALKSYTVRYD